MATTLQIDSFSEINLRERTELSADFTTGTSVLKVVSSEGFKAGQIVYVGNLSREGCEKAVIASVADETTINLTEALKLPHKPFEPVQAVLGDQVRVYRAANVNGQRPDPDVFSVLATREINADHYSTYYSDSDGSSNYWYAFTYFNATTLDESNLTDSVAVRGDDFGHYASITEIRVEAGFEKAFKLKDSTIDQQRRAAEAEINAALGGVYSVPFSPVPEIIHTLTIQLATALLLTFAYGSTRTNKEKLEAARKAINEYKERKSVLTDENGIELTSSGSVTGFPDDLAPRSFRIGHRF